MLQKIKKNYFFSRKSRRRSNAADPITGGAGIRLIARQCMQLQRCCRPAYIPDITFHGPKFRSVAGLKSSSRVDLDAIRRFYILYIGGDYIRDSVREFLGKKGEEKWGLESLNSN